jgi:hypothetical protein
MIAIAAITAATAKAIQPITGSQTKIRPLWASGTPMKARPIAMAAKAGNPAMKISIIRHSGRRRVRRATRPAAITGAAFHS